MTAGQYPLVAFYDANGKPIKLAEATSIVVGSISATNYQNLPSVGGGIAASAANPGEIYFRNYTTDNPSGITIPDSGSGVLQVAIIGDTPVYSWISTNDLYVNVTGDTMTGTLSTPDIDTGFIDFDVNANPAQNPGRVRWNDSYKTLEIDSDNSIVYRVGQEISIRVENGAGTSLSKGQVVYINGFSAGIPTVALAGNTSESQTHKGMGVLKNNLATNGSKGSMVVYGILDNINTTAYGPPGTIVYLGTAGAITSAYADAPNHPELIGTVVKQDSSTGSLFIHVQHGYELHEIHDVSRTAATNGQVLTWNSTAGIWEPQTPTTGQVYTPNPSNPATASVWQRSGTGLDTYYVNKSTTVTAPNQILVGTGASAVGIVTAPTTANTFLIYDGANVVWFDHLGQADPHTQYLRESVATTGNQVLYTTGASSISATSAAATSDTYLRYTGSNSFDFVNPITGHTSQADPHTQYLRESVATQANQILYTTAASSVSATSAAATANTYLRYTGSNSFDFVNPITGHVAESDPHTQYLLETGTNTGQIVYRKTDGSSSSINVANADNGKYLKYASATNSYTWDTPAQSTNVISKSITIVNPSSNENVAMFYADSALTITKMVAVLRGDSTPSVTWTIKKDSSRTGTGTQVVTGGTTTTSITTGDSITSFNSASISSGSYVWLETSAQSGTVYELHVTIIMQ